MSRSDFRNSLVFGLALGSSSCYTDIYEGRIWKCFQAVDGVPFLSVKNNHQTHQRKLYSNVDTLTERNDSEIQPLSDKQAIQKLNITMLLYRLCRYLSLLQSIVFSILRQVGFKKLLILKEGSWGPGISPNSITFSLLNLSLLGKFITSR